MLSSQSNSLSGLHPIVPVVKSDGSSHNCGDHKVTLNSAAKTDTYPFPNIEGLFKDGPG